MGKGCMEAIYGLMGWKTKDKRKSYMNLNENWQRSKKKKKEGCPELENLLLFF